ncbi:MAG: LamG-like jellyroll fold domain-containing protein [Candidatus Paceibacterota bacterium]
MKHAKVFIAFASALLFFQIPSSFAVAIPTDKLSGYWKLDETSGTTAVDNSGKGNNGVFVGNPLWVKGQVNGALVFNGTTDSVKIPDSPIFDMKDFSVSAWIKLKGSATTTVRIVSQQISGTSVGWGLLIKNNRLSTSMLLDYSNASALSFGPVLNDDKWHHVAMTRDTIYGKITLWVDGKAVGTQTAKKTATYAVDAPVTIGSNNGSIAFFSGRIDEVRMYGRTLGTDEISAMYTNLVPMDKLFGYWKLDEMSGTTTVDRSSYDNTGTLIGNPLWVKGQVNGALVFNGTTDFVRIPDSSIFDMKDFSVSAWIKLKGSVTTTVRIAGQQKPGTLTGWGLLIKNNRLSTSMQLDYSDTSALSFGSLLNDGKWHHVAMTRDTAIGKITLWIDGKAVGSQSSAKTTTYAVDAPIAIGSNNGAGAFFPGRIDEARIYGKALSANEIGAMYADVMGVPGDTRPNIVVIMTDDQDDTGSMAIMPKTKQLLIDQGITFKNSFVDFPLCCPSRASFLTSQYAHNSGVMGNDLPNDGGYLKLLPTDVNTLPVWLEDAGYNTALIGKYLNGFEAFAPKVPPGWRTWIGLVNTYAYYNYTINENGFVHSFGSTPEEYQTDVLATKAADYIGSNADSSKPFFLWLAPVAPHLGSPSPIGPEPAPRYKNLFSSLALPTPPNFNEADVSDKPTYLRELTPLMNTTLLNLATESFRRRRESILSVDDMVEKVVNALKAAGKYDNTVIVYTSDNGYYHGEHRRPMRKMWVYEESIRVPLVISGPGIPKGQIRNQMVLNLDVTATVLDLAKALPGRQNDGGSLVPIIKNDLAPWRTAFLVEGIDQLISDTGAPSLYGRYSAIRTLNYKYAEHVPLTNLSAVPEKEMYNLSSDPYEMTSVHDNSSYGSAKSSLKNTFDILKTCAGPSCWITTPEPAKPSLGFLSPMKNAAAAIFSGLSSWWNNKFSPAKPLPKSSVSVTPPKSISEIKDFINTGTTLGKGMSDENVTKLQTFLSKDQMLYPAKTADGVFGTTTEDAVKLFQERYKVGEADETGIAKEDGTVGSVTLKKINEVKRMREIQIMYGEE